jgi:hypothetical protein
MYLCIYLFFYFLFQKDSSFLNMFYNENNLKKNCRPAPHSGCPGRPALPCPVTENSGRVSAPALPCPAL